MPYVFRGFSGTVRTRTTILDAHRSPKKQTCNFGAELLPTIFNSLLGPVPHDRATGT